MPELQSKISEAAEAARRNAVAKMWLHYYNNTLLEQGLITKEQHRKMKIQISCRKPSGVER